MTTRPPSRRFLLWPFAVALCLPVLLPGCRTLEDEAAEDGGFDQAAFGKADENGDGKLSKDELALHKHREALAEFDADRDNHISAEEWKQARPSSADSDEHFNRLDKNGDGLIAEDEAVLFITEHVDFGDSFKKLDADGDFHLHWEEIDAGAPTELNVTLFSVHPDA